MMNALDEFVAGYGFTAVGGSYMTLPPMAAGWQCARDDLIRMMSDVSESAVAAEREAMCAAIRKDAELLAWVLAHPETAADCLEDAAAGDGTARSNLERRIEGIAQSQQGRANQDCGLTLSQRMRKAGHTRRPSSKSLPSDE